MACWDAYPPPSECASHNYHHSLYAQMCGAGDGAQLRGHGACQLIEAKVPVHQAGDAYKSEPTRWRDGS